jgi:hypothetical protein
MSPFLENTFITDLGFGGGFALWGFRAMAAGCGGCRTLRGGFHKAFNQNAASCKAPDERTEGLSAMKALAGFCRSLGENGKRKIVLSESGTMRVTADEVSVAAALSAAQANQLSLCRAHLLWLQGNSKTRTACEAAAEYGQICAEADIFIEAPRMQITQLSPSQTSENCTPLHEAFSDSLH